MGHWIQVSPEKLQRLRLGPVSNENAYDNDLLTEVDLHRDGLNFRRYNPCLPATGRYDAEAIILIPR